MNSKHLLLMTILVLVLLTGCTGLSTMMGNVGSEKEFVVKMIPHHQEAVEASKIIVASTNNPRLKELAQNIITTQENEIKILTKWVESDYNGDFNSNYQKMMPDFKSLSGVQQDNAYLKGMIMHHKMAVMMAESVLRLSPSEKVKELAKSVITVQTEEIEVMNQLLQ